MKKELEEKTFKEQERMPYAQLSRRAKRSVIFHLLYAAEAFDYQESLKSIVDNLNRGYDLDIPFDCPEVDAVQGVIEKRQELDDLYIPLLSNWRIERLGIATKLILRFAIWELLYTNIDKTIVINEAVELAKSFAEKDSYKFINGILDKIVTSMNKK